jgi:predicted GNAT family acetyltransferase
VSAEPEIVISDAPERKRFELTVDGELAGFLIYRAREGLIALIHTEVEDGYEGRDQGLAVLPFCPFVNDWIKRHREYVDLVPAQYRANFEL